MSETKVLAPTRAEFKSLRECKTLAEAFSCAEFLDRIKQSAPAHVKPQRMLRTFVQATSRTPKLLQCNMRSVLGAMLTCSEVGLEPNTLLQHAFLIPFERTKWNPETRKRELISVDVQLIFGYPGLLDLAYRSGHVTSVHADVVWKADTFDFSYGTDAHLRHIPSGRHEQGEVPLWAYAHASLTNGQAFEAMPWADVLRIRNQTQGFQAALRAKEQGDKAAKPYIPASYTETPWVKHQEAMAKKTAFRSLSKWLPKSVELAGALALDEQQDHSTVDFGAVLDGGASIADGGFIEGEPLDQDEAPDATATFTDRRETPVWDQVDNAHTESTQTEGAAPRSAPRKAAAKKAAAATPQDDGIPFERWNEEGLGGETNQPPKQTAPVVAAGTQATGESSIPNPLPVADPVPVDRSPASAEAPAPEERSTQPPSSGGQAFSAWLMDADGTEMADEDGVIPRDPFNDPVAFARAFVSARGNLFPADLEAFEAANKAGIAAAMIAGTEVAPLLITEPPPAEPTLPMAMPIDPAFIALPSLIKLTKPTMIDFNRQLEERVTGATTLDWLKHIQSVNEPTYEAFAGSFRLAALAMIENRRRELTPAPSGQMAETMEQLAVDMIHDIHSLISGADCDAWEAMTGVKAKLHDLETNDPERWKQVLAALRSAQLLFAAKGCQSKKDATELSKDPVLIERMRWLRENAPLVRTTTASEMDRLIKALP